MRDDGQRARFRQQRQSIWAVPQNREAYNQFPSCTAFRCTQLIEKARRRRRASQPQAVAGGENKPWSLLSARDHAASAPVRKLAGEEELLLTGSEAIAHALRLADVDIVAAYPIRPYDAVMQQWRS